MPGRATSPPEIRGHRVEALAVDKLERRGTTRARMRRVTASTADSTDGNVREVRPEQEGFGMRRRAAFVDDRQRPLGPDEEVREVVADDVFDDFASGRDDLLVSTLRVEDVLLGRPVAQTREGRALCDVAADHGVLRLAGSGG